MMRIGKALSWSSLCMSLMLLIMEEVSGGGIGCASGCGNFTNIKHPFRLGNDPPNCGKPKYELACENNVTLLYLFSGKYRVLGINYHNYTIRIVDAGVQQPNCSSLPRYFLTRLNFSGSYYYIDNSESQNPDPYRADVDSSIEFQYISYFKCRNGVVRNGYVDTAPCLNLHSEGHMYALIGDLMVGNLTDECELKLMAMISVSSSWNQNLSYGEIHSVLSRGFELSWWPAACNCSSHTYKYYYCYFNSTTAACEITHDYCFTPLRFAKHYCGNVTKLRAFAEGVGISRIRDIAAFAGNDYNISLSQLGINTGVITGRYLLPLISARFLLGLIFLLVLLIYTCRTRHLSMYADIEDFLQLHDLLPVRYSYKDLKMMTNGFKTKIGQGGFGTVYQGKLRSGPLVAIKMLGKSKDNGKDFISEVATIGRIHHFNVVHLIGFCVEGSTRALVYEFMSNGSLDKYIFSREGDVPLNYGKIYEISLRVARGIAYLHHGCDMQILHFDIKPHNILLDDNFTPKISDFGLAKLYPVDDSVVTLTAARGTLGYMAPELFYQNIGGVSYKADVYSFGMLLMEMASRRKNFDPLAEHSSQFYFPFWIYDQFIEENDINIEDLTQEENNLAKKMFIVALWCIQLKPSDRPSMNKVVEMLEGEVESLEMPPKPSWGAHEAVEDQAASAESIHSSSNPGEISSDDE
ncbi:LEAF RUST 10 DISEASE-RESISTANCE LOCUS RECEPTOR-LIKE PROTEIN KINASE-like 2.1 [Senna tora]|uniref:LEAF RUST 10 DISEASE-RESISTANCE LOCUS RECEPTOR-LIKE PROTEIN KINASE-like 2.1 n=1 Tax=Senna tora TaxID=362788 RepID=A0A834U009_9FABA|nr:LEAF RUST 10 DISEASE-RESISTANCE LOCUS RECEPTOR-LIKE PROTEIN KINASE-like 2.1 [Senna tora]